MYIGNDLQIAHPSYKIIDDISSGFNGSQTSFALQVSGATPVPFPISTQQVMISVNGVVQEPDPSGSAGFKLLGSNIVFSSAPANGHAFFGVINAGADYVTAGSEFPDGSATAPSFTFQDDQDTGWYRNASGDVGYTSNGSAILNFDGNGLTIAAGKGLTVDTSTLKVDATNNRVGIGLTAPSKILHIASNANGQTAATIPGIRIENTDTTAVATNVTGELEFFSKDSSEVDKISGFIKNVAEDAGTKYALTFGSKTTGSNATERMRIDSSGKVGIGDSSPTKPLTVGTATPVVLLDDQSSRTLEIRGPSATHNASVLTTSSHDLIFGTNNTERMRIDSSGRVGIGTAGLGSYNSSGDNLVIRSSGTTGLTLSGGATDDCNIFFGNAEDTHVSAQINYDNDTNLLKLAAGESNGVISFCTVSSNERMRITSTGRLGIGVTSPSSILHIQDSDNTVVHLGNSSYDDGVIQYYNGTLNLKTGSSNGDRNIGLFTAGSERLRIGSSGQLGIGGATYGTSGQVLTSGGSSAAPSWTTISAAPTITGVANGTIAANAGVLVESDGKLASVAAVAASLSGVQSGYGAGSSNGPRYLDAAYDEANQTIVFISCKAGSGGPYVAVQAATISGTGLTYGNKLEIATTHSTWSSICSLGGGKYVAVWQDNYGQSSDSGQGCVISVSGTTCSKGSNDQISNVETQFLHVVKVSSTKVVICWRQANFQSGYLTVGTISGTTLTWGSNSSSINSTKRQELCYIGNNKVMFTYCDNSGPGRARIGTVSGTAISLGSTVDYTSNGRNSIPVYNETAGRGVILFNDPSGGGWRGRGFTVSGTTITLGTDTQISGSVGALSGHGMMDDDGTVWCTNVQSNNGDLNFYKVTTTSGLALSVSEQNNNISNNTDVYYDGEYLSANVAILSDQRYCISWGEASSNGYQSARIRQYPSTTMTTENFVGFSSAGYTNGQTATINVVGNKLTSSSLTPGRKYYVQDNGSVGLTAGVVSQVAGRALTSTSLLITMS